MACEGFCRLLLSRTLNLCDYYRRNPERKPEKCWDEDYYRIRGEHCPNNTVAREKAHQEYLFRKPYMLPIRRRGLEERSYIKDLEEYDELYPETDRLFEPEDLETVEAYDIEEAS